MLGIFRLVLALNVVFFHLLKWPLIGQLAVYSFFILSGMLMTTIMHKTYHYNLAGLRSYALNRFYRLFPVYWVLLLITFVCLRFLDVSIVAVVHTVIYIPERFSEWMANILLIYPNIQPNLYTPRLAPASWALTIELVFYLLIGLGISKTKMRAIIWFWGSVAYCVAYQLITGKFSIVYSDFLSASLPFSIGALLYFYKNKIVSYTNGAWALPTVISLFILNVYLSSLIIVMFPAHGWKIQYVSTIANLGLSVLLIPLLMNFKTQHKSKDTFFGNLSYPIYIFHFTGSIVALNLMTALYPELTGNRYIVFGVGLFMTILVCVGVNWLVDGKIENLRLTVKDSLLKKKSKVTINSEACTSDKLNENKNNG